VNRQRAEAERWFGEAEADLATAIDLVERRRYNWACFVAQQAAEKAVKAVYLAHGERNNVYPEFQNWLTWREKRENWTSITFLHDIPMACPLVCLMNSSTKENGEDCVRWAGTIIEAVRKMLLSTWMG